MHGHVGTYECLWDIRSVHFPPEILPRKTQKSFWCTQTSERLTDINLKARFTQFDVTKYCKLGHLLSSWTFIRGKQTHFKYQSKESFSQNKKTTFVIHYRYNHCLLLHLHIPASSAHCNEQNNGTGHRRSLTITKWQKFLRNYLSQNFLLQIMANSISS